MPLVGIDENGLGPRMGPLVVTGVRLAGPAHPMERLRAAAGLDDSKSVFSGGRRARGEALALAILGLRSDPGGLPGLLSGIGVRAPWGRPPACPFDAAAADLGVCPAVASHGPLPRWGASGPSAARDALDALGVVVERVSSVVLCPGALNARLERGVSKLAVDLALFETVGDVSAGGDARVVCGKVGATDRYASRFSIWSGRVAGVLEESRAASRYLIDGVGEVMFALDADATEPAVAMASVVGKYVRELWMDGMAASFDWRGPHPSGYHDRVTASFLEHCAAAVAAGRSALPAYCLLRLR